MNKILKYGCFGVLGMGLLLLISLPILLKLAFGPRIEIVEIKQQIGGKLICKSEYNADIASWFYDIDYEYETQKGDTINIGRGAYYGREWNKDEQIIRIGEWMILKTGGEHGTDKLLIGKGNGDQWRAFGISPKKIETDSLWLSKEIFVKQNWSPQESFVREIIGTQIIVEYLYRIGEAVEEQETRLITYDFEEKTGIPKMTYVELKK